MSKTVRATGCIPASRFATVTLWVCTVRTNNNEQSPIIFTGVISAIINALSKMVVATAATAATEQHFGIDVWYYCNFIALMRVHLPWYNKMVSVYVFIAAAEYNRGIIMCIDGAVLVQHHFTAVWSGARYWKRSMPTIWRRISHCIFVAYKKRLFRG